MRILALAILLIGCGTQTVEEKYLEEYQAENPDPRLIGVLGTDSVCWTVNGSPDKYLSITPAMSRGDVFEAAEICSRFGNP